MPKSAVTCFVQPGDSIHPLLKAINAARKSIEIVIFRFDRREIEKALAAAVTRGVHVHALIAYTNRGGEVHLRQLETRLLGAGVMVSRTDNDLVRYHSKLMIIDRQQLFLLAFNFTWIDIEHSRSFGILTTSRQNLNAAVKLFEADTQRHPYTHSSETFIVSPINARKQLSAFIAGSKSELLIYDPEVSDPQMIRALEGRAQSGVKVQIIGELTGKHSTLESKPMPQMRLHTRTIIRDGSQAFVGSQSLRAVELDARREAGIIFRDPKAVALIRNTFLSDWQIVETSGQTRSSHEVAYDAGTKPPAAKVAGKVARSLVKELGPITPVMEMIMKEVAGQEVSANLDSKEIEASVKDAVKEAVREAVRVAVEEAVEAGSPLKA